MTRICYLKIWTCGCPTWSAPTKSVAYAVALAECMCDLDPDVIVEFFDAGKQYKLGHLFPGEALHVCPGVSFRED